MCRSELSKIKFIKTAVYQNSILKIANKLSELIKKALFINYSKKPVYQDVFKILKKLVQN